MVLGSSFNLVLHKVEMFLTWNVFAHSAMLDNVIAARTGRAGRWSWLVLWILHNGLAVLGYVTAIACGLLLIQQALAMFRASKKLSW
jgi:hypothetical protein